MNDYSNGWWGDFTIELGATAQWELGPLRIAVQRLSREWLIAHEQIETTRGNLEFHFDYHDLNLSRGLFAQVSRYVSRSTVEPLTVLPALADRSVVSRPLTPFTVLADERATTYVSTPLWFTIATGAPSHTIFEIPIQRPSDTWFGSSTQEGEACYASRTFCRLNLENLSHYSHRAVTEVHIQNNSPDSLQVERLNLPVPYLSLFQDPEGVLWTEAVTMVQTSTTALATFNIDQDPPPAASGDWIPFGCNSQSVISAARSGYFIEPTETISTSR